MFAVRFYFWEFSILCFRSYFPKRSKLFWNINRYKTARHGLLCGARVGDLNDEKICWKTLPVFENAMSAVKQKTRLVYATKIRKFCSAVRTICAGHAEWTVYPKLQSKNRKTRISCCAHDVARMFVIRIPWNHLSHTKMVICSGNLQRSTFGDKNQNGSFSSKFGLCGEKNSAL